MDYTERKAWADTLKVGDKVAIKNVYNWMNPGHYDIAEITYITPKRTRIDLSDGMGHTDGNGNHRPRERWGHGWCIEPITPEIIEINRRALAVSVVTHFKDWAELDLQVLEGVAAIVDTYKAKKALEQSNPTQGEPHARSSYPRSPR